MASPHSDKQGETWLAAADTFAGSSTSAMFHAHGLLALPPLQLHRCDLVHALAKLSAHGDVAKVVRRQSLARLMQPVDDHGCTILHVAARLNSRAVMHAVMGAPTPAMEADHAAALQHLRKTALAGGCAVTPHAAKRVMAEWRAVKSRGEDALAPGAPPPLVALRRRWHIVRSMQRLERLAALAQLATYHALLRSTDAVGRGPLHYAATCKGHAVADLLALEPQWAHARGCGGGRLFPPSAAVCMTSGALVSRPAAPQPTLPDLQDALRALMHVVGVPWHSVCDTLPQPPAEEEDGADDAEATDGPASVTYSGAPAAPVMSDEPAPQDADGPLEALPEALARVVTAALQHEHWSGEGEVQPLPGPFIHVATLTALRQQLLSMPDAYGCTPLHLAAVRGDATSAQCLIANGAEPAAPDSQGCTPLDLSSHRVMRRILAPLTQAVGEVVEAAGGDFADDVKEEEGGGAGPPLASSTQRTEGMGADRLHSSSLSHLLQCGSDPNTATGPSLRTPLHLAAAAGDVDTTQWLLQRGAAVDAQDATGASPLHIAAANACGGGRYRAVAGLLLAAGANVQATSSSRATPLHYAARLEGKLDLAGLPAHVAGAVAEQYAAWKEGFMGGDATPLGDTLATAASEGAGDTASGRRAFYAEATRMVALLVKHGAPLHVVDAQGCTPLHLAAAADKPAAVDALLHFGARPDLRNAHMATPLHLAAGRGNVRVCRLLVRWDAEFGQLLTSRDCAGRYPFVAATSPATRLALTTLWEAAAAGQLDTVSTLLRKAEAQSQRAMAGGAESTEDGGEDGGGHRPTLPPAPWGWVTVAATTRTLKRTALHCAVTGAAAALARCRESRASGGKLTPTATLSGSVAGSPARLQRKASVAVGGADPIQQNRVTARFRLADVDDPDTAPPAPSASNVVAGIGLVFCAKPGGTAKVDPLAHSPPSTGSLTKYPHQRGGGGSPPGGACVALRPVSLRQRQRHLPPAVAHVRAQYTTAGAPTSLDKTTVPLPVRLHDSARHVHPHDVACEKRYAGVLAALLASGADAHCQDADGVTALMLACRFGLAHLAALLLQSHPSCRHLTDKWGNTALHWACACRQAHMLHVLATAGPVDVDAVPASEEVPTPRQVWGKGLAIAPRSAEARLALAPPLDKAARLAVSAPV